MTATSDGGGRNAAPLDISTWCPGLLDVQPAPSTRDELLAPRQQPRRCLNSRLWVLPQLLSYPTWSIGRGRTGGVGDWRGYLPRVVPAERRSSQARTTRAAMPASAA